MFGLFVALPSSSSGAESSSSSSLESLRVCFVSFDCSTSLVKTPFDFSFAVFNAANRSVRLLDETSTDWSDTFVDPLEIFIFISGIFAQISF